MKEILKKPAVKWFAIVLMLVGFVSIATEAQASEAYHFNWTLPRTGWRYTHGAVPYGNTSEVEVRNPDADVISATFRMSHSGGGILSSEFVHNEGVRSSVHHRHNMANTAVRVGMRTGFLNLSNSVSANFTLDHNYKQYMIE